MNKIKNKKEWDFIISETHEGDRENRIKRELLFILQGELSKQKQNLGFYKAMKQKYLNLDTETCASVNMFIKEHENNNKKL